MKRSAYSQLLKWKNSSNRKPLIIRGARQVGKTWLMKAFGDGEYENTIYINCERNPSLRDLFAEGVRVDELLLGFRVLSGVEPQPNKTLIIIDEIQAIPLALTALKYFYEDAPEYHVVAAGSLLGVALHANTSFPVGKVAFLDLYPLRFGEFLQALNENELYQLIASAKWKMLNRFSDKLRTYLRWYYLVGGMPEAVSYFCESRDFNGVRNIQKDILKAYEQDFSKHAPVKDVPRIRMVWNSIPSQLAKENKKFIYGLLRTGARAKEFELSIQWLMDCGLVHKVTHVAKGHAPLKAYEDGHIFKLFLLDVGLLSALSDLHPNTVIEKSKVFTEFKGALTEQFVLQELQHTGKSIHYWSSASTAEIDFLLEREGEVIPIEVKVEENLKSKSLRVFQNKFSNERCYRLSMSAHREESWLTNIPLFAVEAFFT